MGKKQNRNQRLLSPSEAASLAGVSPKTLARWEKEGLIQSVRNSPNSHRRYRECDILARINGGDSSPSIVPPKNRRKNDDNGIYFDEDYDNYSEPASGSPDDRYTSWERDTHTARAELEIERINQEKQLLLTERARAKQEAVRRAAAEEQSRESEQWLRTAKDAAILMTNTTYTIPGSHQLMHPPPSVVAKMVERLDNVVNLSTCPMPSSPTDQYSAVYAYDFATNSAKEVIDEWLESERQKWEVQNRQDSSPRSSESYGSWSLDDWDEEQDEGDEDWDDNYADDDDGDDDDWEDYYA